MIENNVFNMIRQSLMNKNLPFFRMFTINGEKLFEQFNCCYLKTLAHLDEWEEAISSVSSQTLLIMGKKENLLHFFDFSGLLYYQKKIYINEKKVGTLIFGGFLLEDHHCPIDKNEKIIEKMSKRTIEEITDKVKEINEEINELTSYFPKLLLEIIEKLKQNFTHNYTLSELSRYFFVHETTINRLFKKYTNQTFGAFYRELKFEYALKQLNEHFNNIEELAIELGYSETSSFKRALKSYKNQKNNNHH